VSDPAAGQRISPHLIGLTGGIATGKSTVANYLTVKYRYPILDADVYARDAVQPGSPILARIAERFGYGILLSDGNLDRQRLGERIFNDPEERQWLEAQIHPYVRDRFLQGLVTLVDQPVIVLVIPLLFEAEMTDLVDEIWVVTCSPQQQLERLQQRNGLTAAQAQARIDAQMLLAQKAAQATVVLDNSSTLKNLQSQIDKALAAKPE
jgi:dephospho-CoA kinase